MENNKTTRKTMDNTGTIQENNNWATWTPLRKNIYHTYTNIAIYQSYFYFKDDLLFLIFLSKTNSRNQRTQGITIDRID
jgi:hypothetical protein